MSSIVQLKLAIKFTNTIVFIQLLCLLIIELAIRISMVTCDSSTCASRAESIECSQTVQIVKTQIPCNHYSRCDIFYNQHACAIENGRFDKVRQQSVLAQWPITLRVR